MANGATTRAGLKFPIEGTGELVDPSTHIEEPFKRIDELLGAFVCTSGARPSAPFVGQWIYETDTEAYAVCIGTSPIKWRHFDTKWQSYTPTWKHTNGTVNATLGNGSVVGRYFRRGLACDVRNSLTIGSTSGGGTGFWTLSLPFPAFTQSPLNQLGVAYYLQTNSNIALVHMNATDDGVLFIIPGGTTSIGATAPGAWSSGHTIRTSFTYELAA